MGAMTQPEFTREVRKLDPRRVTFRRNKRGQLVLILRDGEVYEDVQVRRTFPLSAPNRWLSVCTAEEEEIGLLPTLDGLDKQSRRLLQGELEKRYFLPQITVVHSVRSVRGVIHWEVETDRGPRTFEVRGRDNIRELPGQRLLIRDIDGNRYEIRDYRALDPRTVEEIERFI